VHRAGSCCAGQDIHDARRVADSIGIPHYVLDYESRFRADVIDRFADSYLNGETPVPCIECNRTVKFRDLLGLAEELGADALATGHYVRSGALPVGGRGLYRAADPSRDQSYFLHATTRAQLDLLRFPLGHLPKSETRALAAEFGLAIAEKPDSQDICFVPNGRYVDVIQKLRPEATQPGRMVHLDGRIMGRHDGVLNFTVGQRKGLGLATGEPLYVVAIDADKAEVIVGPREALARRIIRLRDLNWLGDGTPADWPADGIDVAVRVRSSRKPRPALLRRMGDDIVVELAEAEEGVSPGQACAIYDSDADDARVLGGGTILREPRPAISPTAAIIPASALA
jgi:tRNA-specific 2-thiouridylase